MDEESVDELNNKKDSFSIGTSATGGSVKVYFGEKDSFQTKCERIREAMELYGYGLDLWKPLKLRLETWKTK